MSVNVSSYTYKIKNRGISDVSQLIDYCRVTYGDTWFEDYNILFRVAADTVRIDLCYESCDTLVLYTGDRIQDVLWYSYETQNVYYGDPALGAIWVGNLMVETGLSCSKTEVFAEFLAFKGNINKFRSTPNTNLLAALLRISPETDSSVKKGMDRILFRSYSANTVLNSMIYDKDKSQDIDLDVTFNRMIYSFYNSSFNDITIASRNPGMAEYDEKTGSLVFNETFRDNYLKTFGIRLPIRSSLALDSLSSNRYKNDYFLKTAHILQNWCRDCK